MALILGVFVLGLVVFLVCGFCYFLFGVFISCLPGVFWFSIFGVLVESSKSQICGFLILDGGGLVVAVCFCHVIGLGSLFWYICGLDFSWFIFGLVLCFLGFLGVNLVMFLYFVSYRRISYRLRG